VKESALKVIRYHEYGEPSAVIELADLPSPEPGPGEVVISLEAAPIHLADIKNITGQPWFRAPLPATPGYEGVGRIKAVGKDVVAFVPGDRVFLPTGFGTWKEEFLAPASGLWRAPEGLAAEQLALLPINLQTAYLMLRQESDLRDGDFVIQNAANSNVGYYVIRLAKAMGLLTINVVRRADALDGLLAMGGDAALIDGEDLAERVAAVAGDVRLAIDAVGGGATARLASCLGQDGRIINYGFLSGDVCEISTQQMMFRQLRLSGFFTRASLARMSDAAIQEMRDALTGFISADAPQAPIAGVYRFSEIREALSHAGRRGSARSGKVILTP
jgi:NADPH:quinone reductase-like Zn-dependent oxidoreductase